MATPNAIAVALFNAAAGGYTAQITADPNSLANAVGLILEKDISNDALFVEHLLANFGIKTSMSIYTQARSELFNLVATQGRGKAVVTAIDFLKSQEGAWNDYAQVALNFSVKVNDATIYSANNPTQRDISKLVAVVTGVDTDQVAISDALASTNPAFSASLQSALAAANAAAQVEKTAALAAQKSAADAAAKAISDKAAADLKAAQDKFNADALAAKAAYDKVIADTAATLKAADNLAIEAALKAAADKAAAVAAVDRVAEKAAAVTAFLKTTAASLGLTGYESMTDTQLVNIIKSSDNQATASAVDKTTDNALAVTNYLKSTASGLGIAGFNTMTDSQLVTAIRTSNDDAIAAAVDRTTDNALAVTTSLKASASGLGIAGFNTMTDAQLITAIRTSNDEAIAAAVDKTTDNSAAVTTYLRTTVAGLGVGGSGTMTDTQLINAIKVSNDPVVTGQAFSLSVDNDTILANAGGNDTITATNLTYATDDLIVDTSLTDNDTLTLSTANDISAAPVVVGIENFNVNVTSSFAGDTLPSSLAFNADNLRNSKLNFDVTNGSSNVTELVVTNLPIAVPVTSSSKFTKVAVSADTKAAVTYTGFATNLTLDSAGTLADVTATVSATTIGTISTDSDASVIVTTAADTTITAAAALSVRATSSGQATVVANLAKTVTVTAIEEAIITANVADTVTFVTGDGIDSLSVSTIDSTITSTNANTMTVNVAGNTAATSVDISGAPNVNRVNVTGTPNVTLKVSLVAIDGLGTATTGTTADDNVLTVIKGNSGTTDIFIKTTGGDADFSAAIVSSIIVGAALAAADDLTVATDALIVNAADQTSDIDIIAKNSTATNNNVFIAVKDNAAAGVTGHLTGGLKLTTFATATLTNNDTNGQATLGPVAANGTALTIAAGTQGFTASTASINLNTGNLSVTGAGAVNLGNEVTAAAVLGTSALGPITIGLKGLDYVGNVTTGSGNDVLSIYSAVRNNTGSYTLATGSGTDSLTLSIVQSFTWNAGADYDTLKFVDDLDLSTRVISLTSVDEFLLDAGASGLSKTVTINPTTFSSNNVFNLRGTTAGGDVLVVQGLATAEIINANQVSIDPNFAALRLNGAAGNDTITGSSWADTINGGSGNDLLSGGNYGDTYVYNTGDVDAGETIVEPVSGTETDTVAVVTSTEFTNMVASSFDEIEAVTIASGQTVIFTGLQLTGEVIAFSGTAGGVETLTVNVGVGTQFTSLLTNAAADINLVQYIGSTGDESIAGGAMTETITGGTGNDLLSGGAGNDTFIFTNFATNGIDRITLSVTGTAIDDKLNFAVDLFNREATVQINKIADATLSGTVNGTEHDNVLIIKNVYCADAAALAALTTTFSAIAAADVNVLVIYASSSTTDARIAVATVTNAGDISVATDVAVLVGLTVANASDYFAIGNFIL